MIWFTADFHLSHKNIIKYCNRPFLNVDEMDETLINNITECLNPKDILYFLGDLTFKKVSALKFFEALNSLEIQTHFITGNHDSSDVIKLARKHCISVSQLKDIIINDISITLCHYAMRVWNKSHFNSWQLFGHSHGKVDSIGKQYDIGIDRNNYYPVSFDKLNSIMDKKQDNFNYISP